MRDTELRELVQIDPWFALAAGIAEQAKQDLRGCDLVAAIEALFWWLEDAPDFFDLMGTDQEPAALFVKAVQDDPIE